MRYVLATQVFSRTIFQLVRIPQWMRTNKQRLVRRQKMGKERSRPPLPRTRRATEWPFRAANKLVRLPLGRVLQQAASRAASGLLVVGLLGGALGCQRGEPPGAGEEPGQVELRLDDLPAALQGQEEGKDGAAAKRAHLRAVAREEVAPEVLGTADDNLPFGQPDLQIASIAWRTWIYTDTGPHRTRLGYLRAGAVVDARGPLIKNDGCSDGWYRINPRGFVCMGKGATADLKHRVAVQLRKRPERRDGFPYVYALSKDRPPHRYFRLPTKEQMEEVEGEKVASRAAAWRMRAERTGLIDWLGMTEEIPDFLTGGAALEKPYGVDEYPRREVSAGRLSSDSGFALLETFLWQGRGFGLTTEMDLVPLDRTSVVRESDFMGIILDEGETLPAAFHVRGYTTLWRLTERGSFVPAEDQREKRAFQLTGRERDGMLETAEGIWVARAAVRIVPPRDGFPSIATGSRRWIDVSMKDQTLVAYRGKRPVFVTLISAGRGGLGEKGESNPEGNRTVRGTFMIHEKTISSTMDGEEDRSDSFELKDVPFVQYFHRGFALHGAYWHEEFGRRRSHGCINLSAKDAAWLFEWTDPPVPEGWHAVQNKERGTVVYVGY